MLLGVFTQIKLNDSIQNTHACRRGQQWFIIAILTPFVISNTENDWEITHPIKRVVSLNPNLRQHYSSQSKGKTYDLLYLLRHMFCPIYLTQDINFSSTSTRTPTNQSHPFNESFTFHFFVNIILA